MVKVKEQEINDQRLTREGSVEGAQRFMREGSAETADKEDGMWTEESDEDVENAQNKEGTAEKDSNNEEQEATDNILNLIGENEERENKFPKLLLMNEISTKKRNILIFLSIIILLSAWVCNTKLITKGEANYEDGNKIYKKRLQNFYHNIEEIKRDFPSQGSSLWNTVFYSIKYVNESRPIRPAIILLLHNNNGAAAECLAWRIGKAASNFLNTPGIIELPSETTLDYADNEIVIEYKEPLKKKGVMIVYRLDQMPALAAQSFHTFCDMYNPLVNRAVLLFTLNGSELKEDKQFKPNKKAMELMKSLWKDTLIDAKLDPLITRLTENVLEVKSEAHISCQ